MPRIRRAGQSSGLAPTHRRTLTDADREAWLAYVRHTSSLPGRPGATLTPTPLLPKQLVQPAAVVTSRSKPPFPLPFIAAGERPSGLDDSTWIKLRTGKLRPDRTLDLHGQTAQRAFHALEAFLNQASAQRLRCVEIITGRGNGEGGGILRRELPLWLNLPSLRPSILALIHPHIANPGSIRVLLRRRKP